MTMQETPMTVARPTGLSVEFNPGNLERFRLAVRRKMREQGLSARKLGSLMGVTHGRISQLLACGNRLSAESALILASTLGLKVGNDGLLPELGRFKAALTDS